jgi:hypothetical protein
VRREIKKNLVTANLRKPFGVLEIGGWKPSGLHRAFAAPMMQLRTKDSCGVGW